MKLSEFRYELPEELIAHYPPPQRAGSRLLHLDRRSGAVSHHRFPDLLDFLRPEDLLVFNDTRVIPARLLGQKATGGRVEALIERITGPHEALVQIRASKSPKPGMHLLFETAQAKSAPPLEAEVLGRHEEFFQIRFLSDKPLLDQLDIYGHIPLPPYIRRADEVADRERYQTVFNARPGAVAAPTAGLHFDENLMTALQHKGVDQAFVTLHVGSGTFQPVRVDNILEHRMHSESIEVNETVCQAVRACRSRGGRIIAVGTTSVRCLESAAWRTDSAAADLHPYAGETDIFIYPGFEFRVIDGMITNFHLSESTLLMLVSAFAGRENIFNAYQQAIEARYRFFSYGDAMLIL